jgi:hypothetical protein
VIGRGELIVGVGGLGAELGPLTDVLLIGEGATRDSGVKTLNQYLSPEVRAEVEAALHLAGLTPMEMAQAHLRLAEIMARRGPEIAARLGATYPTELERAVREYVEAELRRTEERAER